MKTTNKILALVLMAVAMAFASCSKDDDVNNVPSQQEIETKILGRWKNVTVDGVTVLTNDRNITYYGDDKTGTSSDLMII